MTLLQARLRFFNTNFTYVEKVNAFKLSMDIEQFINKVTHFAVDSIGNQ